MSRRPSAPQRSASQRSAPQRRQATPSSAAPASATAGSKRKRPATPAASKPPAAGQRSASAHRPASQHTPASSRRPSAAKSGAPSGRRDPHTPARGVQRPTQTVTPQRHGGGWGLLSWRTGALAVVIALAFAVVMPTVRNYVGQQQMLGELRDEVARESAEVADLEAEAARWEDESYIIAQARERLGFVFEGETAYRVTDPEYAQVIEEEQAQELAAVVDPEAPWWDNLAASLRTTGSEAGAPVD